MYPRVPDLVQAGRSVGQTLARKESESATLIRLHTLASGYQARYGGSPPSAEIKKSILRTRPPGADKLDAMVTFLVDRPGGFQGGFMKWLTVFHRNFVKGSLMGWCASEAVLGPHGLLGRHPLRCFGDLRDSVGVPCCSRQKLAV